MRSRSVALIARTDRHAAHAERRVSTRVEAPRSRQFEAFEDLLQPADPLFAHCSIIPSALSVPVTRRVEGSNCTLMALLFGRAVEVAANFLTPLPCEAGEG